MKKKKFIKAALCAMALALTTPCFAVENFINYQGELTDSSGTTIDGTVVIVFSIWDDMSETDPAASRLWYETQTLNATNGIFNAQLGSVNPLAGVIDFANPNLYLEIAVDGVVLGPRTQLTSTAAAFHANEADTVDGYEGVDLDQSGHVADVNSNPHNVTASQVGAASAGDIAAQVDAHAALPSTHHSKTSSFTELTGLIAETQIPSTIARDSEIDWNNLTNIPAGFADGVDDGGGAETDPEVGANTTNYVSKWNGSALVSSSIYDDGTVGIGTETVDSNSRLYVYNGGSEFGPGKSSIYGYRVGNISAPAGGAGWDIDGVSTAIKGLSNWGNNFSAGIAGYSYLDYGSSAAVVGSKNDGLVRGMLAYQDDDNKEWAGFFEGDVKTTGEINAINDIVTDTNFLAGNDVTAVNDVRALNNVVASNRVQASGNVQAGGDFTYTTPKRVQVNIPACEFRAQNTNSGVEFDVDGSYLTVDPNVTTQIYAPLHLPDGAEIKYFDLFYYDNDPNEYLWMYGRIKERSATTPTADVIDFAAPKSTEGSSKSEIVWWHRTDSFSDPFIYKSNFYHIRVILENSGTIRSDDLRFYGATIIYDISTVE